MRPLLLTLAFALAGPAVAQAIFTEYVEGSSLNKALEVTNVSDAPLDLSTCRIQMFFNGEVEAGQDFTLSGQLGPGEAHVFYHHDSGRDYDAAFRQATRGAPSSQSAGYGWFNGNDAIVLSCNGQVADSLGQVGNDADWGKDVTLRRTDGPAKEDPRASFDAQQYGWQELRQDTFDGLGTP